MERLTSLISRAFFAACVRAVERRRARSVSGLAVIVALGYWLGGGDGLQAAGFDPPPLPAAADAHATRVDRIYLVSTRAMGTACDCGAMADGLQCEELVRDPWGNGVWRQLSWTELSTEFAQPLPTVVFVHGNRIDAGVDKPHGLECYDSLACRKPSGVPIRYIIWSWPSSKAPGILHDYRVKAARTGPVAWQLAWAVDQLPLETPLTLVGYSYGGRVVTGALHLLAGGDFAGLHLEKRVHPERPPIRAALLAAAVHESWIRPGNVHGRALEQVDQMLLINNHRDPAMRFYHLAFAGRVRPLGYGGIARASLGAFADRVRIVDATGAVGRSHALGDYVSNSRLGAELHHLVNLATPVESEALAERN
ncbi:MAG TPA: hypothetical protein VF175_13440 [Lacipirellula sp.]